MEVLQSWLWAHVQLRGSCPLAQDGWRMGGWLEGCLIYEGPGRRNGSLVRGHHEREGTSERHSESLDGRDDEHCLGLWRHDGGPIRRHARLPDNVDVGHLEAMEVCWDV